LDLSIVVEYGSNIPDVAWEVQDKVKTEIETMTGINVESVNVSVDGINVPADDAKQDAVAENSESVEVTEE
ncbi:MAG: Asp23/Gls24 family envelope stress response protein, partial [Monoglobaceae bacterium]